MIPAKILLIDDEVGFTQILKMNLERSGEFEVRVENDSRKALSVAGDFRPDIVILDISMPGLDGGEVAAQFAEHPVLRGVPIVVLTGLAAPRDGGSERSMQVGCMKVLPKPVSLNLLMKSITNAIGDGALVGG